METTAERSDVRFFLILFAMLIIAFLCLVTGMVDNMVKSIPEVSTADTEILETQFNRENKFVPIITGETDKSHAELKHYADSELVRNCIDKNGADLTYFKDDKYVQLCIIPEKGLGIRVLFLDAAKRLKEITAYINPNLNGGIIDAISYAEMDAGKYGWITWVKECWRYLFILK